MPSKYPEGSPLATKLVQRIPSRTELGRLYEVRSTTYGALICDCPGFLYRRDCWHVRAVRGPLVESKEEPEGFESLVEMFEKIFPKEGPT